MKKTMAILLSAIMMIVMLTGCIHQDMGVKMNKDGTGSITTTLGIEKDFYDQLVSMGSDPFEGKTTTEYEYDGSAYISYAESKEYSSYEEMEQALLDMTYETELIEDAQEDTSDDGEVDGVIDVAAEAEEAPAQDNHIFSSVSIEKDSGIFQSTYTFHAVLNAQSNENPEGFIRNMLADVVIKERPPADVPYLLREFKRIGNNINQILLIANTRGFLDTPRLRSALEELKEADRLVFRTYAGKD